MLHDVKQFSSDKILKHVDRIDSWLKGENPVPITVELDMTNACNHECPECVVEYFRQKDASHLSRAFAEKIIRQLAKIGIRGLIFTGGGEPLCNKATPAMVELANQLGMDVGFITNGSLINKKNASVILKNSVWVRVSLDAATPGVFKKMHGLEEKEFNKVIDNIRLLARLKKKNKYKCTVGVGFLTSNDSIIDMEKAAVLCKEIGVDYLQYRPMQVHKGGKFAYHWTDVSSVIDRCLRHSTDTFKVLFSQHKYEMMKRKDYGRDYGRCYGHQFATVIAATGKMYICCHLRGFEKYCIGDLNKNTFKQIWQSDKRRKIAGKINFKDCIPLCRDNTFNQVLWNIKQPREHVNFL